MNEQFDLAGGVVAAVVVIAVLALRGWKTGPFLTGCGGVVLLAIGLGLGVWKLPERDTPQPLTGAVGVLPPPPRLPQPGRGFAVSLAVHVNSCSNPVAVTVIAAGTTEYWADYRAESARLVNASVAFPFVLVLPEGVRRVVRAGVADGDTALTDPADATMGYASKVHILSVASAGTRTLVTGTVAEWPRTLLPLMVRFQANWLAPRGLSTCYLRLPALSGSRTATAVVAALGGCDQIDRRYGRRPCSKDVVSEGTPYVADLVLTHGEAVVHVDAGEVSPSLSVPPPPAVVSGEAAWTCVGVPDRAGKFPRRIGARVPNVVQGVGGGAFSVATIEQTAGGTCRAVAVITENTAAWSRDLLILILGAIVGLGLTLLVQGISDSFRDHPRESQPASPSDDTLTGGTEAAADDHSTA